MSIQALTPEVVPTPSRCEEEYWPAGESSSFQLLSDVNVHTPFEFFSDKVKRIFSKQSLKSYAQKHGFKEEESRNSLNHVWKNTYSHYNSLPVVTKPELHDSSPHVVNNVWWTIPEEFSDEDQLKVWAAKRRVVDTLKKIDKSRVQVKNAIVHAGSFEVQSLRSSMEIDQSDLTLEYEKILQELKVQFEEDYFTVLKKEFASHFRYAKNQISQINGLIRSAAKAISLANAAIDKRIVYRKKNKVIFRMSDDEDLNK